MADRSARLAAVAGRHETTVHREAYGAPDVAGVVRIAADRSRGEGLRGLRGLPHRDGAGFARLVHEGADIVVTLLRGDDVHHHAVRPGIDVPAADSAGGGERVQLGLDGVEFACGVVDHAGLRTGRADGTDLGAVRDGHRQFAAVRVEPGAAERRPRRATRLSL